MRPLFAALLLVGFFSAVADAANVYPSGHEWRAFSTEHFEVIYYEDSEFLARKAAVVAEDVYGPLTRLFHWEPRHRIRIVVSDDVDDSNGYSSLQPWDTTHIFVTSPHTNDRLDNYDDWIRMLVTHELTHAIHLDSARGIPLGMRYVFGRYVFLHHYQPIFMVEGLAVHEETRLTTKGRDRATVSEMMMRAAVLEDEFPPIDTAANWTRAWPGGGIPYNFGGMFHEFIARRYGPESIGDYSYKHAGQVWPFLFNHNAKLIFGKPMTTLWKEFEAESTERYIRQAGTIEAVGVTPTHALDKPGRQQHSPFWLDNDTIAVEENSPTRRGRLAAYSLLSGRSKRLRSVDVVGGSCALPDGRIVYSEHAESDPFTQLYDLYVRELNGRVRRLTWNARLRDPAAAPDGRSVYAVAQNRGRTRVVRVDLVTGGIETIISDDRCPFFVQYNTPAVSPDGRTLVLSVWHDDGNRDLFAYDLETGEFTRLTSNPDREIDPAFSADGGTLYFVSDRNGVYNVYALDRQTRKLQQVTNVLTGVFEPAPSPDGRRLALVYYSAEGFDVRTLDLDPANWTEVAADVVTDNKIVRGPVSGTFDEKAEALEPQEHEYSPWRTLLPSYWQPLFSYSVLAGEPVTRLGFNTSGTDSIYRHGWTLGFVYDFRNEFANVGGTYAYDRFYPTLRTSFVRSGVDWGDIAQDSRGDTFQVFQERVAGAFGMSVAITDHLTLYTDYIAQNYQNRVEITHPVNPIPTEGFFSGFRFGAGYQNLHSYAMSVTPEDGGFYFASGAVDHSLFGSDYDIMTGIVSLQQFVSLPFFNNVWEFDLKAGAVQGDKRYRGGFRVGGFTQQDLTAQTVDNRFALRGFASGSLVGERAMVGSFDWHTPIWYEQRGLGTWPIYFNTLSGSAFVSAGKTWFDRLYLRDPGEIYESYGFELYQSLGLAYYSGTTIRFVYAYAPDRKDPASYYIGAGTELF